MKTLTKLQIINETVNRFNSNNRAVRESGECIYCSQDGRKCAVGVYMDETNTPDRYYGSVLQLHRDALNGIDTLLVPEVRGHEIEFWKDVQDLHDNYISINNSKHFYSGLMIFWDENGLTDRGRHYVKQLKEKWGKS